MVEKGKRATCTLESKLEAVQLIQGDQACAMTAKVPGIPKQMLKNWMSQVAKDKLAGAGTKPMNTEQMSNSPCLFNGFSSF